jgi:predicted alpha/beta-hydrolase family hydrolase
VASFPTVHDVATPRGLARAHLHEPAGQAPLAALALGHGAGGGIAARDLIAATEAALDARLTVALIEQPYRVAGRRAPAPAAALDAAWIAVIAQLREHEFGDLPLIVGGRSAGARVACRTAAACDAIGVLCLAFPLRPPRRSAQAPASDRQHELDAVAQPMLVVQGASDPFGIPPAGPTRKVVTVPGNHSLNTAGHAVSAAVRDWLATVVGAGTRRRRAPATGR